MLYFRGLKVSDKSVYMHRKRVGRTLRIVLLFSKPATDAATDSAKKALSSANDVQDLFNGMDSQLEWERLNAAQPLFEHNYGMEYSAITLQLVDNIKTNMIAAIDAQVAASREISKWCSIILPLFTTYLQQSAGHSASMAQTQHRTLQKVLTNGVERMKLVHVELRKIATNLNAMNATFPELFKQMNTDYDEKSKLFQTRLSNLTHPLDGKPNKVGRDTAIAELQSTMKRDTKIFFVMFGYSMFSNVVHDAVSNIPNVETQLKQQIQNFEQLIDETGKSQALQSTYNPELLDFLIKSTQNLFAKCTDYNQNRQLI